MHLRVFFSSNFSGVKMMTCLKDDSNDPVESKRLKREERGDNL